MEDTKVSPVAEDNEESAPTGRNDELNSKLVGRLSFIVFLHWFSFATAVPALGDLTLKLYDDDNSAAGLFLGILSGTVSLMQFFTSPMYGIFSDRYGRIPFINLSQLSIILGFIIVGALQSKASLVLAAILGGLISAFTPISSAMIFDVTPAFEQLPKNFGYYGASLAAGLILGSGCGGGLLAIDGDNLRIPFFVGAILEGLNLVFSRMAYPETVSAPEYIKMQGGVKIRKRDLLVRSINPMKTLPVLTSTPRLAWLAAANCFQQMSAGTLTIFLVYSEERFGWTGADNGAFLFVFGISAVVALTLILKRASGVWTADQILARCVPVLFAANLLYGVSTHGWMWYVVVLLTPFGLCTPAVINAEQTKEVPGALQGKLQGGLTAVIVISNIFGSLTLSGLFSFFVSDRAPVYLPGAPYFLACLFVAGVWYCTRKASEYEARHANKDDAVASSLPTSSADPKGGGGVPDVELAHITSDGHIGPSSLESGGGVVQHSDSAEESSEHDQLRPA